MTSVPILTFNQLEPARQLQQRLAQAGIQAILSDESRLARYWFMSEPQASIHVEVDHADYLAARRLSRQWDPADAAMQAAVRCPECGSSRVEFPQITRKFVTPVVQALLMAMRVIPRKYYCLDCQFTWPKEKPAEPERDLLGWPRDSKLWHPEHLRR